MEDCTSQYESLLEDSDDRSAILAWSDDEKVTKGIVVYLDRDGGPCVVRGVINLEQQEPHNNEEESETDSLSEESTTQVEPVSTYSAALCKNLSSERTLAVQAALT